MRGECPRSGRGVMIEGVLLHIHYLNANIVDLSVSGE